jgi:hypothetical protein
MVSDGARLRDEFLLDPDVTFLNHGSFGATPRAVFERYQEWQLELERQPVLFLARRLDDPGRGDTRTTSRAATARARRGS